MPTSSTEYTWNALWNKVVGLLSNGKAAINKESIVPAVEGALQGFTSKATATVMLEELVKPGEFIGQLMAEAAGLRSDKGAMTPASRDAADLFAQPILRLRIAKQPPTVEAEGLFLTLAQMFGAAANRSPDGSYAPVDLSIGTLVSCGGIVGVAKMAALCSGFYASPAATTLLSFISSLVYYSDPAILITHLGGKDATK